MMVVLEFQIRIMDEYRTCGQVVGKTKNLLCWTHWFFGTYTTKYSYIRDLSVAFDVDYYVVYRWKL